MIKCFLDGFENARRNVAAHGFGVDRQELNDAVVQTVEINDASATAFSHSRSGPSQFAAPARRRDDITGQWIFCDPRHEFDPVRIGPN